MFLLPHTLYLPHNPSRHSPKPTTQAPTHSFIWERKHPRIRNATLCTPIPLAGMGAPDVRLYYKETILNKIKQWWNSTATSSQSSLMQIEQAAIAHPLKQFISAIWLCFQPPHSFYQTVNTIKRTRRSLSHQAKGIFKPTLKLMPLSTLEPPSEDPALTDWSSAGIQTFGTL